MSEQSAVSLLEKAVKELNEKDSEGAVAKIKLHVKLVQTNNTAIQKLQESNKELLAEISKLSGAGGLKVSDFASQA